jgi:hypothetical protein
MQSGLLRRPTTRVHVLAGGLFAFTVAIRLLALVGFPNDHFLYLAPAQQMLAGELPSRDFVDPGTPLVYALSAMARLLVDSPLLAEALVVATAFGVAAALTAYAAFLASGSLWLAALVTIAEIALFPRSYHYPKLLVHAAGVLAIWAYASAPSWRRAALLAACVVVGMLFRHDHGVSLGVAAITTAVLVDGGWKHRVRSVVQIAGLVTLLALPYLLHLQAATGIRQHLAAGMEYSRAEAERTMIGFPSFDRSALTSAENVRVALFYMFHLLPAIAIARLAWTHTRATPEARSEWPPILPVAALAIVANVMLLRDPLQARLPDVAVPAGVLAAWLIPHAWRGAGWTCAARRTVVLLAASLAAVAVNVVGAPVEQLDRAGLLARPDRLLGHARERVAELQAPFPPRQLPNDLIEVLVPILEYVGRCTTRDQRLFVAGDAPEIYVFARRLFAGGQPALRSGFFSTLADQRRLVLKLRRQDVPLAFILTEGDARTFALVMAELDGEFQPVADIAVGSRGRVLLRVNRHNRPYDVDAATGLPCFAHGV